MRLDPPDDQGRAGAAPARQPRSRSFSFNPAEAVANVGTIGAPQLLYAAGLLEEISPVLATQVHDLLGAQATVFALLLDPDPAVSGEQLSWLERSAHPAVVRQMRTIVPEARRLAPEARLPLVELSVPALRQMSPAQMREFLAGVKALVAADHKLTLFEYALQRLLLRHLVTYFVKRSTAAPIYTSFEPLTEPTTVVLSALARGGAVVARKSGRRLCAGRAGSELARCPDRALARNFHGPESSGRRPTHTRLGQSTAQEADPAGMRGHRGSRRPCDG